MHLHLPERAFPDDHPRVFRILLKKALGENVLLFEVEAPRVARRHRAGQFVMVRPHANSERIPLTIADVDRERGSITLVVQAVGKTTIEMSEAFAEGDAFANVAGPLGNPTHIGIPGIVYRRSREEMPARLEEVHHAEQEGVQFRMLSAPVEILAGTDGWVRGLRVQRCELGEPDEKGRRRPVPIEGAYEELLVEIVIEAIGNGPNPLIPKTTPGLTTTRHGTLVVDEQTMMTTRKGVFAGGDIVAGASTVILAMGHGRKAAAAIDAYLSGAAAAETAAS